ncbi:hypothetical protein QE152_g10909 [Popillia japonica]|uniref:Uncharacterized protein n=1 Tax=Popillia japonica TaxID=7064 RepID=A0AAW1LT54_POPJA
MAPQHTELAVYVNSILDEFDRKTATFDSGNSHRRARFSLPSLQPPYSGNSHRRARFSLPSLQPPLRTWRRSVSAALTFPARFERASISGDLGGFATIAVARIIGARTLDVKIYTQIYRKSWQT